MIPTMTGLARPEHLATTSWLAERLGQPGIAVVDARWRPDGSAEDVHAAAHIAGAVQLDWRTELIAADGDGEVLLLADAERVGIAAARIGAVPGATVIIYDDSQSLFAARVWWSLRAYGIDDVRVLDGGYPAWVAEGRPVSSAAIPGGGSTAAVALSAVGRLRVTTADVRGWLGSSEVVLLDARAAAEYKGFEGNTKRLGHIPGAINVPVGATSEPGGQRLRDAATLHDRLRLANIGSGRRFVCYDGSGVAAAKLAWVLTLLGHEDVAVYDGGWADWGNRLDLPVDR
jgi:thiosulfate/3-mercaptopyruvate sulfurtransferase